MNFDDFCYKFEENFTEIDKIGDNPKFDEITKFEILNPKIQNFQFRQNLTKNHQNLSKSPNFLIEIIKFLDFGQNFKFNDSIKNRLDFDKKIIQIFQNHQISIDFDQNSSNFNRLVFYIGWSTDQTLFWNCLV